MPFTIKVHSEGVAELLKSNEVLSDLTERARRIASAAGEGMEVEAIIGKNRARASVRTATIDAMIAEATQRTLTRAIDAGRG